MDKTVDFLICRDYIRNVCNRGNRCKFRHPPHQELEALRNPQNSIPICHDFINGTCGRLNCKYQHIEKHDQSGQDLSIPYCKDFIKGQCKRGALCKFRHLTPREKNSQRSSISILNNQNNQSTTILPVAASCNGQQLYIKVDNNNQISSTQNGILQGGTNSGTIYAAVSGSPHQIHQLTSNMPSAIVENRLLTTTIPAGIPVVMTPSQSLQNNHQNTSILSCENDRFDLIDRTVSSVSGTAAAAMAAASVFVQSTNKNNLQVSAGRLLHSETINQLMPTILNSAVAGANAFVQSNPLISNCNNNTECKLTSDNNTFGQNSSTDVAMNGEKILVEESLKNSEEHGSHDSKNDSESNKGRENEQKFDGEIFAHHAKKARLSASDSIPASSKESDNKNSLDQLRSSMAMTAAAVAAVAAAAAVEHHHMQQKIISTQSSDLSLTSTSSSALPNCISTTGLIPISTHNNNNTISRNNNLTFIQNQHLQYPTQTSLIANSMQSCMNTSIDGMSNQSDQSVCFLPIQTLSSNQTPIIVSSASVTPCNNINTSVNSSLDNEDAIIRLRNARYNRKARQVELLNILNDDTTQVSSGMKDSILVDTMTNGKNCYTNGQHGDIISPVESISMDTNIIHNMLLNQHKKNILGRRSSTDYHTEDYEESDDGQFSEDFESISDRISENKRFKKYSQSSETNSKDEVTSPGQTSPETTKRDNKLDQQESEKRSMERQKFESRRKGSSQKSIKRHLTILKADYNKLKLKLNSVIRQNTDLWMQNKILLEQNIRLRESSKQVVAASRATENAAAAVEAQANLPSVNGIIANQNSATALLMATSLGNKDMAPNTITFSQTNF